MKALTEKIKNLKELHQDWVSELDPVLSFNDVSKIIEDAIEGLESYEKCLEANKWTKVEDGMPPRDKDVEGTSVNVIVKTNNIWGGIWYYIGYYDFEEEEWEDMAGDDQDEAIEWKLIN